MTLSTTPVGQDRCPLEDESLIVLPPGGAGLAYDRLAEARASECPVVASRFHNMYVVTRYADVRFVLEHPELFSSRDPNIMGRLPVRLPPLDVDPPLQQAFRKLLNPFFTRGYFARFEPDMRRIAKAAIATWLDRGHCDFVSEFAIPFTAGVLAKLVFDETDRDRLARAVSYVTAVAEIQDHESFANLAVLAAEYLADQAERGDPGESSILASIAGGTVDGRRLTQDEQIGVVTVLFLGGLDTTRGALGNIAAQLAVDPALEDRLRDPGWVKHDLEEFIRFESPVVTMARTVVAEVELAGRTLRPGDRIGISFSSANRDETKFEDPDQLRFDRPRTGHAGFGLGIHRCIGMHLARFQIAVAFDELLGAVTRPRLSPGFTPENPPGVILGLHELQLEFDRR
ncbi:MAG TPA: cytochrome P450 [Pseudonocardia sp.]|jgi:cytochrome P450|nr:cytochrome P450 [Pseudonocardia sp.]